MTSEQRQELANQYFQTRDELLALCVALERIADSLPNTVDRGACLNAARTLIPLMDRAHRLEEDILFPAVTQSGPLVIDVQATFDRLKLDHAGDEYFAEELAETLISCGQGASLQNAEATGYMLRGFFVGLRRHIAFEDALLAPLLNPSQSDGGKSTH